jgi:hypothetical protein
VNRDEIKEILLLYRPGTADAEDPQVSEALELARQDPELARWFERHAAFQSAIRLKLRQIEVPAHLKAALMARQKVVAPAIWRPKPSLAWWVAAAALFLFFVGLGAVWLRPNVPDRFVNFRERMVNTALREYHMDFVTNNMPALRQAIQAKGAPADYELSPGLADLQLTGGGALSWRSHPVSMVCFDRGNKSMVFLFVMKKAAVKDPPPQQPKETSTGNLIAASWSKGDNSYLLLGSAEPGFPQRYLP